jgi:peptide/nickel transport system substrate-binding protein
VDIRERFPGATESTGGIPVEGGHLRVAIPADTPFAGILNPIFQADARDGGIIDWFSGGSVFSSMPNRTFGQHGIVTWEHDMYAQSITLTQVEDVYWHDGVPLTLDDLVFAIETISSPGYVAAGGQRFGESIQRIRGVWEFHNGEAGQISGLVLSADKRGLTIYFNDFPPSILYFGVWSTPYPRHIFGNIPIHDQPGHYRSRVSPIGFGPFVVQNIVPGESVYLVANPRYWQGRPHLDSVTLQIVATDMLATLMTANEFDIAEWRLQDFEKLPNPQNFHYLGDVANSFGVFAFNLGYFCEDTNRVIPFENPRMGDVRLRRAMAYAIDVETAAETIFGGMRFPATSVIPPGHADFLNTELRGFPFNPARAKELLDEAGFIDTNGDGYRECPAGYPFEIYLAVGLSPQNEMLALHYRQNWADVGLNVRVSLRDFPHDITENIFRKTGIREEFDIVYLNSVAGFDPNPNVLWGHNTSNIPRFMNPSLEITLEGFNSPQAWDINWLIAHYHHWQELFNYYVPAIITDWRVNLTAVNNRIAGFSPFNLYEDGQRTRGGVHRIYIISL